MRELQRFGIGLGMTMIVFTAGCSAPQPQPEPEPEPLQSPVAVLPAEPLTVLAEPEAGAAALQASAALFDSSPVVVLADAEDELAAASVAVALGVPLLPLGTDPESLEAELDRLGADHVVVLGNPPEETFGRTVVAAAPTADALEDALGVEFGEAEVPGDSSAAQAVAALESEDPQLLLEEGDTPTPAATADSADAVRLPELEPAERADGLVALATEASASLPVIATARAAGAAFGFLPADEPNPQRSPAAIEFLAAHPDASVVAIGAELADEPALEWKVASARTGLQLPGGGQLLFPEHMMVAIYGTPNTPVLGVLGEQGLEASLDRARQHAAPYEELSDKTVLPAFELITTVASASAGSDGDYSNELDPDLMLEWAEAAGEAGMYAILDLQPGHTDFVTQAKAYEKVLRLPWVGLALDPEWRLKPGERHMVHIGSVHSDEVNAVQDYLAELVRTQDLPPKLLVLHQFRLDMIEDRSGVDVDRPEVTVLIHADGQGSQPAKQDTWRWLRTDAPDVAWGWKNFYDEDAPMLDPQQTMQQVEPVPDLITYQ